jgi:hypothetical protein
VKSYFAKRKIFTGKVAWNSYLTHGLRHTESNTGKSARQGNRDFFVLHWCKIRKSHIAKNRNWSVSKVRNPFLNHFDWLEGEITHIVYMKFTNKHETKNKSARQGNLRHPRVRLQSFADEARRGCRRFPCLALFAGVWFYFSLLSAVFSFVFVVQYMHLPVKRTWFFCLALVQDKKISHR